MTLSEQRETEIEEEQPPNSSEKNTGIASETAPPQGYGLALLPFGLSVAAWIAYSWWMCSGINQEMGSYVGRTVDDMIAVQSIISRGGVSILSVMADYWYIPLAGGVFSYLLYFIQIQKEKE